MINRLTLKKLNEIIESEFEFFLQEKTEKENLVIPLNVIRKLKKEKDLLKESYFTLNNQYYDYSTEDSVGDNKSNLDIIFDWYIAKIKECLKDKFFIKELKKNWLKYLVKNYYVLDPYDGDKDDLEKDIKIYLNYNYQFIQKEDIEEFANSLFKRNFTFISDSIRYFYLISPEFKKVIQSITKEDFQKYLDHIKDKKKDLIIDINECSLNVKKSISISNAFFLFDIDSFDRKNVINSIIMEYLSRVINNKVSKERLIRKFGISKVKILSSRISTNINYIDHINKIKSKKEKPYFTKDGEQIDNKLDNLLKGIDINKLDNNDQSFKQNDKHLVTSGQDNDKEDSETVKEGTLAN